MSRYRSEEDALKARIAELYEDLKAARNERDQLLGVVNQGPIANQWFSRAMYTMGRHLGRLFSKRPSQSEVSVNELRQTIRDLEMRVAEMLAAVEDARGEMEAAKRREASKNADD